MTTADENAASVRATISRKKLAANRRNARKSTGPRSEQGKRVSSYNAVTHGIFCADLVIGGEDLDVMLALRTAIHASLGINPHSDMIEIGLADDIVSARWKLRRVQTAERDTHAADVRLLRESLDERLATLDRRTEAKCECSWDEADEQRIRDEAQRQRDELESRRDGPDPLPGTTMAADFASGDGTWDRLGRYEQRLQQGIARSMRELRAHRKELRGFGRGGPDTLLDELERAVAEAERAAEHDAAFDRDDEDDEAQNEPTAEQSPASDDGAGGCDASASGLGVPPELNSIEENSGETPKPQKERTKGRGERDSDG